MNMPFGCKTPPSFHQPKYSRDELDLKIMDILHGIRTPFEVTPTDIDEELQKVGIHTTRVMIGSSLGRLGGQATNPKGGSIRRSWIFVEEIQ